MRHCFLTGKARYMQCDTTALNIKYMAMEEFPKLRNGQFALLRADRNTGHVLDIDFKLKVDEGQKVYSIFDSLDEAISFGKQLTVLNTQIEFVIYSRTQEAVYHSVYLAG